MIGFGSIFKKSNRYWALLIITVILCYGFALTNISIGVDDEGAAHIWNGGTGMIHNGRFGVLLLSKVFNIMSPLPFWRDFLGVLAIICAAVVFTEFFNVCADKEISLNGQIICACLFVSVPVLAFAFVYLLYVIEFALSLLLAGLALLFFYNGIRSKKIYYYIFCILLLAFGSSFYEHCINHFITGLLCGFLLNLIYIQDTAVKRFVIWIAFGAICSACALLIVFSVAAVLRNIILGVPLSFGGYALSALNINISAAFFADIILRIKNLLAGSIYFKWYAVLSVLLIIISIIQSTKRKRPLIIITAVLILLSTWMMEFLQGSGGVPPRTMIVYAVYFGFCGLYIYQAANKKWLRYAVIFLSLLIVFYNSKEMNTIFYTDYQRYKLDQERATEINREIVSLVGEDSEKPVVFIGRAQEYPLEFQYPGEVVGSSAFAWDGYFGIIDNPRIRGFMSMEGYNYAAMDESQFEEAKKSAYFMNDWPMEGSVSETDDAVIVRLSSPLYAYFPTEEADEIFADLPTLSNHTLNIDECKAENGIFYITGSIENVKLTTDIEKVHILMKSEEDAYIIPTLLNQENGYTYFYSWSVPLEDIKSKAYYLYVIIEKNGKLYRIDGQMCLMLGETYIDNIDLY